MPLQFSNEKDFKKWEAKMTRLKNLKAKPAKAKQPQSSTSRGKKR